MYFTDWVALPDVQVMYGWVMIGLNGVLITLNMSVILYTSYHQLTLICRRHYNIQKHKYTPGIELLAIKCEICKNILSRKGKKEIEIDPRYDVRRMPVGINMFKENKKEFSGLTPESFR